MLRIRDVLIRIQVQILGYVHCLTDPDPDLSLEASKSRQKINFKMFFCISLTLGTFPSVFKDKKSLRSHRTVKNKAFLNFFRRSRSGAGSRFGPVQKGSVPEMQKLSATDTVEWFQEGRSLEKLWLVVCLPVLRPGTLPRLRGSEARSLPRTPSGWPGAACPARSPRFSPLQCTTKLKL